MRIVFITQVYPPDSAAVGQYIEDAAVELAGRGHEVLVLTSSRDYDNPQVRHAVTSKHPNIRVVRIPFSSFGKKSIIRRILAQTFFLSQSIVRLLLCRGVHGVVVTTIPATTGVFFLAAHFLRKLPYAYWVMDINPDQAIEAGYISRRSVAATVLKFINNRLGRGAQRVICLDEDMRTRLGLSRDVEVIPPWSLDNDLRAVPKDTNPFVDEHDLTQKFVFMYSGNHSLVHPLGPLLSAVIDVDISSDVKFVFVGGGVGKQDVEEARRSSAGEKIISLPYQSLEAIKYSLSAADVHIVSFGEAMVGVVHPSKFYSAIALGKPILYLGPAESALGRIVKGHSIGWCVPHDAQAELEELLRTIPDLRKKDLLEMGERAQRLAQQRYSRELLCGGVCDVLEIAFKGESP